MSKDICISIKAARENSGLTQKEVEASLGLRSLSMRDYEVGRLKLPVSVAVELANLYEVSLDNLVGNNHILKKNESALKELHLFDTLFLNNNYNIMFLDPVLVAFLELYRDRFFELSIFEILTLNNTEQENKELVLIIGKLLFSLAAVDGRISKEEIDCIKGLINSFKMKTKYKEIISVEENYFPLDLPKGLRSVEMRHFVVWILFFFSKADQDIRFEEVDYIEKCAELLKVNKSNYLFIKEKFVKEVC
jgi:uncharacterized tellurite resistance protein B-like protein/DNA-binding XRE family transcriptional regulator